MLFQDLSPFSGDGFPGVSVRAAAQWRGSGLLLMFQLTGDCAATLPPRWADRRREHRGERRDHLWQATCLECFCQANDQDAYYEINFSPRHHWNLYRFTGYRQGMNAPFLTPSAEPRITSWRSGTVCHFTAFFPDFHQLINGKFCHVGLSAVLADGGGAKKYYALRHPAAQPDFHHAGGWTLALSASSGRQGCKSHFFHSDS